MDDEDVDELETGTFEDRMLAHAARQTKALETGVVVLEVMLGLGILGAIVWAIAFFGS